jgi:hypothetical protein
MPVVKRRARKSKRKERAGEKKLTKSRKSGAVRRARRRPGEREEC